MFRSILTGTCGRSLRCAGEPITTWMPRLHVRPISVCVDRVRCGKEGKDSENSFLQYCDPHSKPWRPFERRKNLGILECRYCREFSLWESLEQMTEYCEFLWNSDVSFGGKYISNEVQPHIFLFCVLEILCSSCAASSSSRCWDFLKCLFSPSFSSSSRCSDWNFVECLMSSFGNVMSRVEYYLQSSHAPTRE